MYYQTKIQSVSGGRVVDVQGRVLRTIGNFPCQAGQSVWTDGRVIFGHVFEDTGLIQFNQRGIPVVAGVATGYFDRSGKFRRKKIAEDNWVVNDQANYKHCDTNAVDAEISGDNVFKIEVGDDNGVFYSVNGQIISKGEVQIKANDSVEIIDLENYNKAMDKVEEIYSEIEADTPEASLNGLNAKYQLVGGKINAEGEPELIIGSHVDGNIGYPMRLVSHGKYNKAQFKAETFLWESAETNLYSDAYLKDALIKFWEYCCDEIDDYEIWSWKYDETATDTEISSNTNIEVEYLFHVKKDKSEEILLEKYRSSFIADAVNTHEHDAFNTDTDLLFTARPDRILSDDDWGEYGCGNGTIAVYDVDGETIIPHVVFIRSVGLAAFFPEYNRWLVRTNRPKNKPNDSDATNKWLIKKEDYPFLQAVPEPIMTCKLFLSNNSYGGETFLYRFFVHERLSDIQQVFTKDEVYLFKFKDHTGKEHKVWLLREDRKSPRERKFCCVLEGAETASTKIVDDFVFPIQDDYFAKWKIDDKHNRCYVDSVCYSDTQTNSETVISDEVPDYKDFVPANGFFANMPSLSIAPLRGDKYLIGFYKDKLYQLDKNKWRDFDDKLKNFRLREMRNLNRAQR